MALTIDQAINALAAQQGVPPSAVNINDAISYANQSFQQSFFSTPAPAPSPAPAPVIVPTTSGIAPTPMPSVPLDDVQFSRELRQYQEQVYGPPAPAPVLTQPVNITEFLRERAGQTPPSAGQSGTGTGMLMPTVSPAQTDAIVREVSTRFPEDGGRVQEIARLYQETLGRSPDIDGLIAYTASNKSMETIKRDMAYSPEGQTLIKTLFNNTLGRDPDAGAVKTYTEFLAQEKPYIQSYGNSEIEALKTELRISPEGQKLNADPAAAELARIYKEYAGRDLDASGYAYFKDALTSPDGAARIAEAIKTGDEAELRTKLGRQPTEAEAQEYMQAKDAQRAAEGRQFGNFVKSVLPMAIGFAFPTAALTLGQSLGLSGPAAVATGRAVISGVVSGVATGSAEKALVTAALTGAGSYAVDSGAVGNALNNIGLGDIAKELNIPTSTGPISGIEGFAAAADEVGGAGATRTPVFSMNTPSGMFNLPQGGTPGFEGIDLSSQLAGGSNVGNFGAINTGGFAGALPNVADLTQSLINAGISPGTAQNLAGATLAGVGGLGNASVGLLTTGLTPTGPAIPTTTTTPPPTTTTPPPTTTTPPPSSGVTNLTSLIPAANNLLSNLGNLNLNNLVGAGIDLAQLAALRSEATRLGGQLSSQATQIGREAAVPFTPYTVTTGAGVGTVAPGTATATTAPAYEQLRQQQLGLAGQAFGAVNPAQAAQTLYGQVEALAAPGRAREQEALLGRLGARGLLGIGRNLPTVGGEVAGVNPYVESLLSAQETARAQQALQAQQFGTQEAIRQAGLGQGLVSGAQGIDQQALAALNAAATLGQQERAQASRNSLLQAEAALQGLRMRAPYEQLGLEYTGRAITGASDAARGLFGLPTQQGNILGNLVLSQLFNRPLVPSSIGEGTGPQYGFQDYGIFP